MSYDELVFTPMKSHKTVHKTVRETDRQRALREIEETQRRDNARMLEDVERKIASYEEKRASLTRAFTDPFDNGTTILLFNNDYRRVGNATSEADYRFGLDESKINVIRKGTDGVWTRGGYVLSFEQVVEALNHVSVYERRVIRAYETIPDGATWDGSENGVVLEFTDEAAEEPLTRGQKAARTRARNKAQQGS